MIFPQFSPITIPTLTLLKNVTTQYPPHSDINPAGLLSYDTRDRVLISMLSTNIILLSYDYLSHQPFFTFIGTSHLTNTLNRLFYYERGHGLKQEVKLLNEQMIEILREETLSSFFPFTISEDRDNFDYVMNVSDIANFPGTRYLKKRNKKNHFLKKNSHHLTVRHEYTMHQNVFDSIHHVFQLWKSQHSTHEENETHEYIALMRLLNSAAHFTIFVTILMIQDLPVAFSVNEIVHSDQGIIHFEKADNTITGISETLKSETAKEFSKHHVTRLNYEQDLGILSLREAKLSYRPAYMVKKYTITPVFPGIKPEDGIIFQPTRYIPVTSDPA